jgi:hypothetical protein
MRWTASKEEEETESGHGEPGVRFPRLQPPPEAGSKIMMGKMVIALCLAAVVGCQPEPEPKDSHLFFSDVPYPVTLPSSEHDTRLELVQEYGDSDEGLVFGYISELAVSETGTLAVMDQHDCRIWIVDRGTGEGKALGGCGDGPGEFRGATAMAFDHDTLMVFDAERMSMAKITLEGEELERVPLPVSELGALYISDLHIGKRGSLLVGLDLMPFSLASEGLQMASFNSFGGTVSGRGLGSPPLARTTIERAYSPSSFCVGTTEEAGDVVVALNTWGPQIAVLRMDDFEPLLSLRIPAEWAQAQERSRPGYWSPMRVVPRGACGERFVVAGYRRQEYVSPTFSKVLSAIMVIIDLREQSMVVLGGDEPPEAGSILFMTPGAAIGDRFFFYTNSFFDYPVIREYRITRTGEE